MRTYLVFKTKNNFNLKNFPKLMEMRLEKKLDLHTFTYD